MKTHKRNTIIPFLCLILSSFNLIQCAGANINGSQREAYMDLIIFGYRMIRENSEEKFQDGNLSTARFHSPSSMVIYKNYLFISDTENHSIRRITLYGKDKGTVVTYAGSPKNKGYLDGPVHLAQFHAPAGLLLLQNELLIADTGNHCIRKIDLIKGIVSTLTGRGEDSNSFWSFTE